MSTGENTLFYEGVRSLCYVSALLGWSLRSVGGQNVPRRGPALLLANHQSFLDPPLISTVCAHRQLGFLARETLFRNPTFGWIIRNLNAVPVDQEGMAKEGLKTIIEQLKQGRAVVVFPEGSRSPDGKLHALMPGIHLLIRKAAPPIIPVGIAGAFEALPMGRPYPKFSPLFLPRNKAALSISIGKPLDPAEYTKLAREEMLPKLAEKIAEQIERAKDLSRGIRSE